VLIPLVITLWVLRAILGFVARLALPLFGDALMAWPPLAREALAALLVLAILYVVGEITTLVVGRKLLGLGEAVLLRVPFARVIYGASKQVLESFGSTRPAQFRSVVAIDFPHPGAQSIGFITNTLDATDADPLVSVFVPTTPNPTTGFLQILRASQVRVLDISVEEAVKTVMSIGVLAPATLSAAIALPKKRREG